MTSHGIMGVPGVFFKYVAVFGGFPHTHVAAMKYPR